MYVFLFSGLLNVGILLLSFVLGDLGNHPDFCALAALDGPGQGHGVNMIRGDFPTTNGLPPRRRFCGSGGRLRTRWTCPIPHLPRAPGKVMGSSRRWFCGSVGRLRTRWARPAPGIMGAALCLPRPGNLPSPTLPPSVLWARGAPQDSVGTPNAGNRGAGISPVLPTSPSPGQSHGVKPPSVLWARGAPQDSVGMPNGGNCGAGTSSVLPTCRWFCGSRRGLRARWTCPVPRLLCSDDAPLLGQVLQTTPGHGLSAAEHSSLSWGRGT